MNDQKTEIQAANPHPSPKGELEAWGFGQLMGRYFTSIEKASPDAKKRLFSLIQGEASQIDAYLNKEIRIVEYLYKPATFVDSATGEEVTTLVTRIRLADGKIIETHSKGVAQSIAMATELLGMPSLKRPYNCIPVRVPLRDNKSMVRLNFAE